jgi:L-amino acid N-acyltransferase YncA
MQPLHVTICPATGKDVTIIAAFNAHLISETRGVRYPDKVIQAGVKAVLRNPALGSYFLASLESEVIGQLMVTRVWDDIRNAEAFWLRRVYIKPAYRGRGVLGKLFTHVKGLAEAQEASHLFALVHADNQRSQAAFTALGMERSAFYFVSDLTANFPDASVRPVMARKETAKRKHLDDESASYTHHGPIRAG